MHRGFTQRTLFAIVIALSCMVGALILWQTNASGQATLKQRWNPRRVPAGTVFVGDQACAECHTKLVTSHRQSGMAIALDPVADSPVLIQNPQLSFHIGPYTYEIKRNGKQSIYSVTDGSQTVTLPILYALGQGRMGQTYVLQRDGKFYESLVSYYAEPKSLDFTIGAQRTVPQSLDQAVGRLLSDHEVSNCFGCHTTGAVSGVKVQPDKLTPGIRCEACHGPGGQHIADVKAGERGYKNIFNPARLSGDELTQQFCASCHRGSDEFSLLKSMAINNVRFQPYRIFHSKCYSDDRNISCTACHDPHESLKTDAAYYDTKCLACHALKGKTATQDSAPACPVATNDCTSCHMPKIEVKAAHFKFTDHYIRVVKPGEPFPN
jgi:hypothetical protein